MGPTLGCGSSLFVYVKGNHGFKEVRPLKQMARDTLGKCLKISFGKINLIRDCY